MNTSTKEQGNGPDGACAETSTTIKEIMQSVRSIQQDLDFKLKSMEETIQKFLDNLDDDHYDRDDQFQAQPMVASNSPKEQQQGTMSQ